MILDSRDYVDGYFPRMTEEFLGQSKFDKIMGKYPVLAKINKHHPRRCLDSKYNFLHEPDFNCDVEVLLVLYISKGF